MALDVKIHFVANFASKDDLEVLRGLEWGAGTVACVTHTWVWPLYCQMKMRGFNVSISYNLESDAINLIHGQIARGLLKASDLRNYFIVAIRADFRPFLYGQFEIVQNIHSARGKSVYMPLYPQPGLLSRDENRREIVNICFAGEIQNSVQLQEFGSDMESMGCHFIHKNVGDWHDMREVDILIGNRSFSKAPHYSKPPTKLFNAWLAGIPFIGGYDSAYEQVGVPGENYLRVSSYQELLKAIRDLKGDPQRYRHLVDAGSKAAVDYTPDRITDRWLVFFENEVEPSFTRWEKKTSFSLARGWVMALVFAWSRVARACVKRR